MGKSRKYGEDVNSPDDEGPKIQVYQTEINLALTHLSNFLTKELNMSP